MHRRLAGTVVVTAGIAFAGVQWGCRDDTPPPPRVPVPSSMDPVQLSEREYIKPLPPLARVNQRVDTRVSEREEREPPPATQAPRASSRDERFNRVERDFIDAYRRVGQPRFTVLATRSGGGDKPLDESAVENRMAEWISADAQVVVLSSAVARQHLNDGQAKDVRDGRPQALSDVAQQLGADVLVHVDVTGTGGSVRLVGEAVNVKGGQSIGRAMAEMQSPMDAYEIDTATRNLAGKLMAEMIRTWTAPPAEPPADGPPPPQTRP